jgi:hypothetical protein
LYRRDYLKRLWNGELIYKTLWESVADTLTFSNTMNWIAHILEEDTFAEVRIQRSYVVYINFLCCFIVAQAFPCHTFSHEIDCVTEVNHRTTTIRQMQVFRKISRRLRQVARVREG